MPAKDFFTGLSASCCNVIPDIYYLVFTGLLLLLDAIIFFFMFFQFVCNRKLLYVAILGLGFLVSDIYCVEAVTLIQKRISVCIPLDAITNDLAIFYLFRQVTFIVASADLAESD